MRYEGVKASPLFPLTPSAPSNQYVQCELHAITRINFLHLCTSVLKLHVCEAAWQCAKHRGS